MSPGMEAVRAWAGAEAVAVALRLVEAADEYSDLWMFYRRASRLVGRKYWAEEILAGNMEPLG